MPKEKSPREVVPLLENPEMRRYCDTAEFGSYEPFLSKIDYKIESGLALLCEADEGGGRVIEFERAQFSLSLAFRSGQEVELRAAG